MQKRVLSLLVDNTAGVTTRVSGLFSRRGYNIDSITGGVTGGAVLLHHLPVQQHPAHKGQNMSSGVLIECKDRK